MSYFESINLEKIKGVSVDTGAGASSVATLRVILASDQAALPVTGTFWQATQPVSGSVTANAGTNLNTSALALESGGNLAAIAASTDLIATYTSATTGLGDALQYEDDPSSNADRGLVVRVIRKDTPGNTSDTDGDYESLQMSAGRLWTSAKIDNSAGASAVNIQDGGNSITVDGTVAATQSGTWTVQPGNTANTTAWKVDASSVAVPVTDNSGSLTVDAPVGTPVFVRLSDGGSAISTLPVSLATNTPSGSVAHDGVGTGVSPLLVGGYASAAAPTDVSADGDSVRLWALRSGALATQPTFAGVLATTGNGASGTGVQRVTLASDSTGNIATIGTSVTPGTSAAHLGKAEDAGHTTGDTGVMMLAVRNTTVTDLSAGNTDGDYEPPQVNKAGALWVTGAPSGTSGWSVATGSIGATKTDIGTANTAGNVGGWYIYNPNSSVAYVQFFNTQASGVTLGTTAPVYSLGIPATGAANVSPGMVGLSHSTAICIAVTTTRAGSTGPSSTVDYNIWYKQ